MTKSQASGILLSSSQIFVLRTVTVSKPLVFGILLLTYSIFVFVRTVVVTKPLISGVFFINISKFFSNFCWSVFYWLMGIKVVASKVSFSKLLHFILYLVCWTFSFSHIFYSLHHLFFSNTQKQFSTYQHLNHFQIVQTS